MIVAFILGLVSSLHCVGMCGPIAISVPNTRFNIQPVGERADRQSPLWNILLYNAGRITTYAMFGLVFGLIGRSFAWFGWQQKISVTLGVLIIAALIIPRLIKRQNNFTRLGNQAMTKVRTALGKLLFNGHPASVYSIGLLNGLLPCGMVYLALAGAVATGTAWNGSLFMALFGLGTVPAMAAVGYFGAWLTPSLRNTARKLFPAMMMVMATLLILRGMNLGIPYLSPSLNISSSGAIHCHD
jgi:uncharacterized protein